MTTIRDDLVAVLTPELLTVRADFNDRGGIAVCVESTYNTASDSSVSDGADARA